MSRFITQVKRRLAGEETGSSLVLALAFVLVFSILVGVLLSFADTSFQLTGAVRARDGRVYSADGAVEASINNIRNDLASGRDPSLGGTCPTLSTTVNGTPMQVVCQGKPGSGALSPGGINNASNRPENALLALARGTNGNIIADEGVIVRTGELVVKGPLHSNGCITTKNTGGCAGDVDGNGLVSVVGTLGTAGAVDNCADPTRLTASISVKCANRNPPPPAAKDDPGYALTDAAPSASPAPDLSCPGVGQWIKKLNPGVYTNGVALSNLMSCKSGLVVLFNPGTYIFNFSKPGGGACTGAGDTDCEWQIGNSSIVNVVGGTTPPVGSLNYWNPDGPLKPVVFPFPGTFPSPNEQKGACVRPADAPGTAVAGVKFVFGGESRIKLNSGARIELCPSSPASNDQQQIVIQGIKDALGGGGGADGSSVFNAAATPDAPIVSPGTSWAAGGSTPANGTTINASGSCTASTCAYAGGTGYGSGWSASITTRNVTPSPAVPGGANIDSVTLRFARQMVRDGGGSASSNWSSVVPGFFSGTNWYDCSSQVPNNENYGVPECVPAGLTSMSQQDLRTVVDDISQFRLQATASNAKNPTMRFDGIQVVVEYSFSSSGFPAQSGCIVAPAASGGCPFISQQGATTNVDGAFQGTVYVPYAWLDVTINNYAHQVFARGVIARHVTVHVTGSAQNRGAFSLPEDSGARTDRYVLFTAYENADPALPRLRALVRFGDCPVTGICDVNTPGAVVEIQRWSVI